VGHLLLSQATAFAADLVVMGAYGHSHLSEWMFGGVTRTVLREAGLIQGDRAGTTITYRLNVSVLEEALWALMTNFKIRR